MFADRHQAGVMLAHALTEYAGSATAALVAIPRGGVVVGETISRLLHIPLSIVVVKKLTLPDNPELAVEAFSFPDIDMLRTVKNAAQKEIERRKKAYGEHRYEKLIARKKILILVDDGVATGATVKAAARVLKRQEAKNARIILAVPVVAKSVYNELQSVFARIVALEIPEEFRSVGQFYTIFPQVSDGEVTRLLDNE